MFMRTPQFRLTLILTGAIAGTALIHGQGKPSGTSSPQETIDASRAASRENTVMVAQTYLEYGMGLHDFARVALAPDVVRTENGWDTGHDAKGVRDSIA